MPEQVFLRAIEGSSMRVRTSASGLLGKLAHNLVLESRAIELRADIRPSAWSGTLSFPVSSLRVLGAWRVAGEEPLSLAASDCLEIERRLVREVWPRPEIRVEASGSDFHRGLAVISGLKGPCSVPVSLRSERGPERIHRVDVASGISLDALGVREIRGPLGAFKVSDAVDIQLRLVLSEEPAA